MTEQEEILVQRGLAAADLLAHSAFAEVIRSLTVECFATFTETQPHEQSRREDAYNLHRGLQAIESELVNRVNQKDEVVASLDAAHAEEEADEFAPYDSAPLTIQR